MYFMYYCYTICDINQLCLNSLFLFPAPRDGCLQTEVPALNTKHPLCSHKDSLFHFTRYCSLVVCQQRDIIVDGQLLFGPPASTVNASDKHAKSWTLLVGFHGITWGGVLPVGGSMSGCYTLSSEENFGLSSVPVVLVTLCCSYQHMPHES